MKITIRAKNLNLSQDLKEYVEEKIAKDIGKLLVHERSPIEIGVELIRVTRHHQKGKVFRAEVQVVLHGHKVVAEAGAESIKQAIDQVKDELEREIKHHRGKETTLSRKRGRFLKKLLYLSSLARFKKR